MKLTWKLILAFLLVSLFGIAVIVAFTRFATDREFNKFINDRYEAELVTQLADYYTENHTWDGIEQSFVRVGGNHSRPEENRPIARGSAAQGLAEGCRRQSRAGQICWRIPQPSGD